MTRDWKFQIGLISQEVASIHNKVNELLMRPNDLRERLAEAVRLLKQAEWDEHSLIEVAAFLAKEKEKG